MGATLSYVCGASDEPLLYKTVGAALEDAAAQWPERIALIVSHQAIRWSYRHLNDAADRLAAGLLCLGLTSGSLLSSPVQKRQRESAQRWSRGSIRYKPPFSNRLI
jgi:hypothetical protein